MRTIQTQGRPYDPALDGWNTHTRRHVKTINRMLADAEMVAADAGELLDEMSDEEALGITEMMQRVAARHGLRT